MTTVAAPPSNKRRKTGLPPPCFYDDLYSSYRVEWAARKRKFPPSMEVSSLCGVSNDLLLVGMTDGSLSIFRQVGQQSQSEEEVMEQQVAKIAEVNDQGLSDESKAYSEESFGWKLVGTHQLGGAPLTFLHVISSSEKESVVAAGSVGGLWWWNSLSDVLQSVENNTSALTVETNGKKAAQCSSKTQTVNHNSDVSIVKADANDSDIFVSTPQHELYRINISALTTASSKKTPSDWLQEITLPDSDTSGNGFEITSLHLTAARDPASTDSPAASSLLLIGTNQSKVLCWDLSQEAFADSLDLCTVHEKASNTSGFEELSSLEETSIRVTAMASIQPDWWTIAGTIVPSKIIDVRKSDGHKRAVNFLGTWHGPSKSQTQLVSNIAERIQGLFVSSSKLYSIGNSPVVTAWQSPYQLDRSHRIGTNAKSNNVICSILHDTLAVAGVGTNVDLVQSNVRLQSVDLMQTVKETKK